MTLSELKQKLTESSDSPYNIYLNDNTERYLASKIIVTPVIPVDEAMEIFKQFLEKEKQ